MLNLRWRERFLKILLDCLFIWGVIFFFSFYFFLIIGFFSFFFSFFFVFCFVFFADIRLRTEDIWTIHFRPKFGDLFENEVRIECLTYFYFIILLFINPPSRHY